MQHPLQLQRLACLMLSWQPIFSSGSYTQSCVLTLDPFSHSSLLVFLKNSSLIFTKPRVDMMATLVNNHLPLRKYFPNIVLPKTLF
jgi:hypothetical protein